MKEKIDRFVESGLEDGCSSPMDPPQAFHLAGIERLDRSSLHEALSILMDDHNVFLSVLDDFEKALIKFKDTSWNIDSETSKSMKAFFRYMDEEVSVHNAREEKALFPILHKKLVAYGECSPGEYPKTAVDIMEDDHLKVAQASCLIFNLLGIGSRLKDAESRHTIFQIAYDQGREIVETMRLHIFKENEVLFQLAQKWITADEFQFISSRMGQLAPSHKH